MSIPKPQGSSDSTRPVPDPPRTVRLPPSSENPLRQGRSGTPYPDIPVSAPNNGSTPSIKDFLGTRFEDCQHLPFPVTQGVSNTFGEPVWSSYKPLIDQEPSPPRKGSPLVDQVIWVTSPFTWLGGFEVGEWTNSNVFKVVTTSLLTLLRCLFLHHTCSRTDSQSSVSNLKVETRSGQSIGTRSVQSRNPEGVKGVDTLPLFVRGEVSRYVSFNFIWYPFTGRDTDECPIHYSHSFDVCFSTQVGKERSRVVNRVLNRLERRRSFGRH